MFGTCGLEMRIFIREMDLGSINGIVQEFRTLVVCLNNAHILF